MRAPFRFRSLSSLNLLLPRGRRLRLGPCLSSRRERLHIRDQLENPFLGYLSLVGRHDRLKRRNDLGVRAQYRFANVRFVRNHLLPGDQLDRLAENVDQGRASPAPVRNVAGHAAELVEQLLAACSHRTARRVTRQPRLVVARLHDDHTPDHARMLRAAIFGAKEVVGAGLRRLEPRRLVAARQHILLHAKGGNVHAVDHIFRGHCQADRASGRDVKLVDFPVPLRVLKLPHPLLPDHVDIHRVRRHARHLEVEVGAPAEDHHGDHQGDHGPDQFKPQRTQNRLRDFVRRAPSVTDREDRHHQKDQDYEKQRNRNQKEEQQIHFSREGGRFWRKQRKILEHTSFV